MNQSQKNVARDLSWPRWFMLQGSITFTVYFSLSVSILLAVFFPIKFLEVFLRILDDGATERNLITLGAFALFTVFILLMIIDFSAELKLLTKRATYESIYTASVEIAKQIPTALALFVGLVTNLLTLYLILRTIEMFLL